MLLSQVIYSKNIYIFIFAYFSLFNYIKNWKWETIAAKYRWRTSIWVKYLFIDNTMSKLNNPPNFYRHQSVNQEYS